LRAETVVLAQEEDELGNQRLVAYVVKPEQAPTISELRSFCRSYPTTCCLMLLEAIPRMPNGKVNRRALPVLDWLRPKLAEDFIAPHRVENS